MCKVHGGSSNLHLHIIRINFSSPLTFDLPSGNDWLGDRHPFFGDTRVRNLSKRLNIKRSPRFFLNETKTSPNSQNPSFQAHHPLSHHSRSLVSKLLPSSATLSLSFLFQACRELRLSDMLFVQFLACIHLDGIPKLIMHRQSVFCYCISDLVLNFMYSWSFYKASLCCPCRM
jgi:hypothetical protein